MTAWLSRWLSARALKRQVREETAELVAFACCRWPCDDARDMDWAEVKRLRRELDAIEGRKQDEADSCD